MRIWIRFKVVTKYLISNLNIKIIAYLDVIFGFFKYIREFSLFGDYKFK